MKNILLLAYAISPTKGSEYSIGWELMTRLAQKNKVFVLCGASGDHLGDTSEIESYFDKNPNKNIHLICVKPSKYALLINKINTSGIMPYAFYIAFNLWHREAFKAAKEIIENKEIDIIHQYNPIGFREPGYLWKFEQPFIWGPIGGANFIKTELLKHHNIKSNILYRLKNIATLLQLKYSSRVRKAAKKSSCLLFCSSEHKDNFIKNGIAFNESTTLSEQAISINCERKLSNDINKNTLNIAWMGRIDSNKNTRLLLEGLALIKDKPWHLNIIGDGSIKTQLQEISSHLGIAEKISWHGKKKRDEAISILANNDILALSSLSEANTTVVYEAMGLGIPTISLDQNGMHDTLANGNGILIPITTYEETCQRYAEAIANIIHTPDLLITLKEKTKLAAQCNTWEQKILQYEEIYDAAIQTQYHLKQSSSEQ